MVDLVEKFIKQLAKYPDAVEVRYEDKGNNGLFYIKVDPQDVGRIIGHQGKTIQALDTLVTAINEYNKKNYVLKINEDDRK